MSKFDSRLAAVSASTEAHQEETPPERAKQQHDQTVVLFDGGDSGGILISAKGARTLPPFDESLRRTLKSISDLLRAIDVASDRTFARKLTRQAVWLCNLAIEQLEDLIGPLNPNRALVYQSRDGGFVCGALGKPPVGFSWPPKPMTTIADLIAAGAVAADVVELLRSAAGRGIDLIEVFEKPRETAQLLDLQLSEKSADDLNVLAPSRITEIKDDVDREICAYLHAVARHGGFWEVWLDQPQQTARTLGLELSEKAVERIHNRCTSMSYYGPTGAIPMAIPIWASVPIAVIVVGIIAWSHYAEHKVSTIIMDESGVDKI